jgi:hypothetical protein
MLFASELFTFPLLSPTLFRRDCFQTSSIYVLPLGERQCLTSMQNKSITYVGIDVLTAVVTKYPILWYITPRSRLNVNRRFGGTCRPHIQGARISQPRHHHEAGSKQCRAVRIVI